MAAVGPQVAPIELGNQEHVATLRRRYVRCLGTHLLYQLLVGERATTCRDRGRFGGLSWIWIGVEHVFDTTTRLLYRLRGSDRCPRLGTDGETPFVVRLN